MKQQAAMSPIATQDAVHPASGSAVWHSAHSPSATMHSHTPYNVLSSPAHQHAHMDHSKHHTPLLTKLLLGAGLITLGIVASPFLFSLIDSAGMLGAEASRSLSQGLTIVDTVCVGSNATGMAADAANIVSQIPLVGETLAKGGIGAALISGSIGIGGALIGHYVSKNDDGSRSIHWGNVITTAALVTSFLVSMPAILTGIGMGISVLGSLAGYTPNALTPLIKTIGSIGITSSSINTASVILPHLVTCGVPILGPIASTMIKRKEKQEEAIPMLPAKPATHAAPAPSWEQRIMGERSVADTERSYSALIKEREQKEPLLSSLALQKETPAPHLAR